MIGLMIHYTEHAPGIGIIISKDFLYSLLSEYNDISLVRHEFVSIEHINDQYKESKFESKYYFYKLL